MMCDKVHFKPSDVMDDELKNKLKKFGSDFGNGAERSLCEMPIISQICILLFHSPLARVKEISSLSIHKNNKEKSEYLSKEELIGVLRDNPNSFIAFANMNRVTTSLQDISNAIEICTSSGISIEKHNLDATLELGKTFKKLTKNLSLYDVKFMQTDTAIGSKMEIPNKQVSESILVDQSVEKYEQLKLESFVKLFTAGYEAIPKFLEALQEELENILQKEFSKAENKSEKVESLIREILTKVDEENDNFIDYELYKTLQRVLEMIIENREGDIKTEKENDEKLAEKNDIKKSEKEIANGILRIYESVAEKLKDLLATNLLRMPANEEYWPMKSVSKASRKAVPPFARSPLFSVKESKRLMSGGIGIQFSNNEVMLDFLTVALKDIHPKKLHGCSREIPKRIHMPDGGTFHDLSLFELCGVSPLLTHVISHPIFQKVDGMMENMMNRLASFKDWPASAPISALRLVDSGFYFNVQNSTVACYSCALHIETRELACELKDDSVLNMHLRLSEKCPHALQQRHDKLLSQTGSFMFSFSKENIAIGGSVFSSINSSPIQKDNLNLLPDLGNLEINEKKYSLSPFHVNSKNVVNNKVTEKDNFSTNFNSQTYVKHDSGYETQTSVAGASCLDTKQGFPIQTEVADSLNFFDEPNLHPNSLFGDQIISMSDKNKNEGLSNPQIVVAETSEPECSPIFKSMEEDLAYSIRYPEYKTVEKRLKSFESWPLNDKQNKEDLVLCGFFYTGQQDIVRCFSCDIGLAEWDETDEPWSEHARHSPHCKYLKKFKGQDFINRVQQEWRKVGIFFNY